MAARAEARPCAATTLCRLRPEGAYLQGVQGPALLPLQRLVSPGAALSQRSSWRGGATPSGWVFIPKKLQPCGGELTATPCLHAACRYKRCTECEQGWSLKNGACVACSTGCQACDSNGRCTGVHLLHLPASRRHQACGGRMASLPHTTTRCPPSQTAPTGTASTATVAAASGASP